jgi:hypothetical protein
MMCPSPKEQPCNRKFLNGERREELHDPVAVGFRPAYSCRKDLLSLRQGGNGGQHAGL